MSFNAILVKQVAYKTHTGFYSYDAIIFFVTVYLFLCSIVRHGISQASIHLSLCLSPHLMQRKKMMESSSLLSSHPLRYDTAEMLIKKKTSNIPNIKYLLVI